ncbi:MAG: hypothetical protein H0W02_01020 [Ktedonobacteraceae bacterium]|nr:hypothetical protein [Ktedonobacteraceae bacterium]
MTQKRSYITLSAEQTIDWYQHHILVLHSYALALALKAGLSPAEAARVFVEPWHNSGISLQSQATAQLLEQQARQIAEVSALTYGEEHVHVEQQDDIWLIKVVIPDHEPLERYGPSLEVHTQWAAEQLRQVCDPKGIACSIWLENNIQYTQLSLQVPQ